MAVIDPLPIQRAPFTFGPSQQTQPFDIDLLCAKLEVAKLEQDAERARQRLRQLTADDRGQDQKQHDTSSQSSYWPSSTRSTEKPRLRFSPDSTQNVRPKQLFTAVSLGRSDSGESRNATQFPVQSPQAESWGYNQRDSNDELEPIHLKQRPDVPRRKPIARASESEVYSNPTFPRHIIPERPLSRELASHRSKTFPLLPLKHQSMTSHEYTEAKEHRSPQPPQPPRAPASLTHKDSNASMGLVNKYTISFDLADHKYNPEYSKPKQQRQEKSPLSNDLRPSKSILSFPLSLKKDKTQIRTEEVNASPPQETLQSERPSTAASYTWHMRQQSLPVDFGTTSPTVTRPRLDGPGSKRRSFVGWLKKL